MTRNVHKAAVCFAAALWLASPMALADEAQPTAKSDAVKTTAVADEAYTPPPGFKKKTRKGETVYCRSRAPVGTRIKTEECYTELQIKQVEQRMDEYREDIGQKGRMCNSGRMCTGG